MPASISEWPRGMGFGRAVVGGGTFRTRSATWPDHGACATAYLGSAPPSPQMLEANSDGEEEAVAQGAASSTPLPAGVSSALEGVDLDDLASEVRAHSEPFFSRAATRVCM